MARVSLINNTIFYGPEILNGTIKSDGTVTINNKINNFLGIIICPETGNNVISVPVGYSVETYLEV